MSELMNAQPQRVDFRLLLLSTASSAVMAMSVMMAHGAMAADDDHPTVWIELGGQLERQGGLGDPFEAPFMLLTPTPKPYIEASPIDAQRPSRYSIGGEGKLTIEPQKSDWTFSAEVKYGRSTSNKDVAHQTNYRLAKYLTGQPVYVHQPAAQFAHTTVKQSQSHLVMDFMAGKDVGLGMFGQNSSSVFSAGVRFAQFSSKSHVTARAIPHVTIYDGLPSSLSAFYPKAYAQYARYTQFAAFATASRSFRGIGPALSWDASVPFVGNPRAGELTFDWGLNAAVLFGRQKAKISHRSTSYHLSGKYHGFQTVSNLPVARSRSRSVVVPNVGLTAAVSYRIENFKATLGYRGDFFFGAVDTGWDARRTTDLTFHGPFLNFSLGLGG